MRSASPMRVEQSLDGKPSWVGRESASPDESKARTDETESQAVLFVEQQMSRSISGWLLVSVSERICLFRTPVSVTLHLSNTLCRSCRGTGPRTTFAIA